MTILTIRTDKPEAEIGVYDDDTQYAYKVWHAHRELAESIHAVITEQLEVAGKNLHDVQGIVVYQGPGSFTGLRIGITVANALAASLPASLTGQKGDEWILRGIRALQQNDTLPIVVPEYGMDPHITAPKK